ncbi:hypothetical protein HCAG_00074 [Histoplasma mississippiense (nom. inval.)]|uniref:hypothetical protein n=1 Tax=Ajellomyces capsulatus (strain NAm1 / WU24) TaxID=2059318 RepID=UPI000157B31C|nr:hypothetical protein HCAG_00074 [Histoplasma mississippiense (nom. inval.)]EDN02210.1 hypothetical protein HCAG_00074 [Histoplasma mississippiense (nom. inval.)]
MWKPPLNFITIHYAYIVTLSIFSLVVLYPYGNLKAIDAYFFGASSCTESGLNTYDVKDLKTYQQLFIYVIPIISHHAFINIAVVLVRLHWFRKRLDEIGNMAHYRFGISPSQAPTQVRHRHDVEAKAYKPLENGKKYTSNDQHITDATALNVISTGEHTNETDKPQAQTAEPTGRSISFAADVRGYDKSKALYVPPPQERDRGRPMVEIDEIFSDDDEITKTNDSNYTSSAFTSLARYVCFVGSYIRIRNIGSIYKSALSPLCGVPKTSPLKEQLNFLLKHPRRCYTHLFPSGTTWALFAVLFVMNFVDIILMITLDLHNPAVNDLPWGKRILASLFQAASTRHTGTASFNLANVNPAVQVSILVMMYIAIFPIALSTRASNTYEQRALGIYPQDRELDEYHGKTYILAHIKNQLTFDLCKYSGFFFPSLFPSRNDISPFLTKITQVETSASVSVSPASTHPYPEKFSAFGKLIMCAMMLRGRHRGLPSQLDRAVMLPSDRLVDGDEKENTIEIRNSTKIKRHHTH